MIMRPIDNRKAFIYNFEDNQKSAVTNYILKIIREGEKNIDSILSLILGTSPTAEYIKALKQKALEDTIAAKFFIEYLLDWEKLSKREKKKIKEENAKEYIRNYMDQYEPTPRQLLYLKALGYRGARPETKAKAAELIEKILLKKGWMKR